MTSLSNRASITRGKNGVDVGKGVSVMEGVFVIVGGSVIVGLSVIVGVSVMVGVRLGVGVTGKILYIPGSPYTGNQYEQRSIIKANRSKRQPPALRILRRL